MVVGTLSYSRFQALIDQQLRGGKDARTTPARGPTTPPARKTLTPAPVASATLR